MAKSGWKIVKIEQLAANKRHALAMGPFGSRITRDNFVDTGVPVIRGTNLSSGRFDHSNLVFLTEEKANELVASNAIADDLVFTHRGTLGQVGIIPEGYYPRYVVSQSQMKLTCDQTKVFPLFLYYYFHSDAGRQELLSHTGGSGVPAISSPLTTLKNVIVPLPPLPIQRTIADILSAYDDLVENNTRRVAILEEMARSLYQEWFVKFRFPGHEQVGMVASEMGMIPEGWEAIKLGDRIELVYGRGLKADERRPGSIPVYGSSGIVGYHEESLVQGPGIIVGRKGNVGAVYWSENAFYPIDTVFFVKTQLPLYYVYYNLKRQEFINSDSAVPGLSRHQAYTLDFLLPSDELLKDFERFVEPIFKRLINLECHIANLRRTRDMLLPKLISGEIDVSSWVEEEEGVGAGKVRGARAMETAQPVDVAAMQQRLLWE